MQIYALIKKYILPICFIYIIANGFVYVFQRHFIYFPYTERPNLENYQAKNFSVVSFMTQDKLPLTAWYLAAKINQPTILYFHGNAGHIGHRIELARQFANKGFGILLLEYRGYGGNKGSPDEQGFYQDARAGLQFLLRNKVKRKQIVLYGESLGSAVAVQLASETRVCAVILQSPLLSLRSLARYHYPWIFFSPIDKFDSLKKMKQFHTPLLILQGKKDAIVPYHQGMTLFKEAIAPKKMIQFENGEHNNLWEMKNFFAEVNAFIVANCKD